jgi:trehalose 6-phosphate phosphatase
VPGEGPAAGWIERFRERSSHSALFLDFDGTLSDIVARPELATPVPGAARVLGGLARGYALVAVVSGRPTEEVRRLVGVPGVSVVGLYGLEGAAPVDEVVRRDVEAVAGSVPGAWVEDKVASVAVHVRAAADPAAAEAELEPRLGALADAAGLVLIRGKMVLELAPPGTPGKGSVVRREARRARIERCLFAGDDVADLDGFDAMDDLRGEGKETVKVAVRTAEAPPRLVEAADVVVDGPSGLVELLTRLVPDPRPDP